MSESVIQLFEVIEIDPVKGKAASGLQRAEAGLKLLAEVMPIGNLGQRIVARQPINFLFGLTLLRYVRLNIDPSATSEGLVADQDGAAVLEELRMRERLSPCQLRDVVLDPLALLFELLRIIAARLPFDLMGARCSPEAYPAVLAPLASRKSRDTAYCTR